MFASRKLLHHRAIVGFEEEIEARGIHELQHAGFPKDDDGFVEELPFRFEGVSVDFGSSAGLEIVHGPAIVFKSNFSVMSGDVGLFDDEFVVRGVSSESEGFFLELSVENPEDRFFEFVGPCPHIELVGL